jgi:hypothetical protein
MLRGGRFKPGGPSEGGDSDPVGVGSVPGRVASVTPDVLRGARLRLGRAAGDRGDRGITQASLPPAAFQAPMPPWMWQARLMPASCAACTAIAERSPNAQ